MNQEKKEMLLALIDGLSKYRYASQYDEGEKFIDQRGIDILKSTIRGL